MIDRILRHFPARLQPIEAPHFLGNAGGQSGSDLWRYRAGVGDLVLRAWPVDGPPEARLLLVHQDLARAALLGFVPVPFETLDGRTLFRDRITNRLCELTQWLPGQPDSDRPPKAVHLVAGFSGLAAFHRRLEPDLLDLGPAPGLSRREAELEALAGHGFDSLMRRIQNGLDPVERPLAVAWLELATPRIRETIDLVRGAMGRVVPRQRCLLDVRPDHFLFDQGRLTGLLDFGAMGTDTVAADLARILSEWLGADGTARARAMAAYDTIRPLSTEERWLIEVYEKANAILGGWRWVFWSLVEQRTFRDPTALHFGLARGVERLRELDAVRSASGGPRPG